MKTLHAMKNLQPIIKDDVFGMEIHSTDENGKLNAAIECNTIGIYFKEGRVMYSKNTETEEDNRSIEYFLNDHLGDPSMRIADKNKDVKIKFDVNNPENDELMSSHHYYPFGMAWDVPKFDGNGNSLVGTGDKTKYTYNGKELIDDLDINLHDYGFRYYDPAIARWTSVDPLAESTPAWNPYNYVQNTPINAIDPDGLSCVENGESYSPPEIDGRPMYIGSNAAWPPRSGTAGDSHYDSDGSFSHDGNGWVSDADGSYILPTASSASSNGSENSTDDYTSYAQWAISNPLSDMGGVKTGLQAIGVGGTAAAIAPKGKIPPAQVGIVSFLITSYITQYKNLSAWRNSLTPSEVQASTNSYNRAVQMLIQYNRSEGLTLTPSKTNNSTNSYNKVAQMFKQYYGDEEGRH